MSAVVLEGVDRTFPGEVPINALRNVNLTIDDGDYVAVMGPSGSGKSTLLNIIGLLDRPSSGWLRLGDVDVTRAGDQARTRLRAETIGFVFQAFHLIAHRSVLDNVRLGVLYGGPTSNRLRTELSRTLLERVGLGDRLRSRPNHLSAGQQQRVAIARALAGSPRLLLCDEPTGNLDSINTEAILDLLDEIRRLEQITVVVATHDPLVSTRARRVVEIVGGCTVEGRG